MRLFPIVGAVVGLVVIAVLAVEIGAVPIGRALVTIGWPGFSAICLIHLPIIVGMGLAWRAVVPKTPAWILVWGRLVRDAGSEILPLSQIGGLALGARAAVLGGVPARIAAASTIVDVTLEFIAKLAYLGLGLLWLLQLRPHSPAALWLTVSLALTAVAVVAFLALQRYGLGIFDRGVRALAAGWAGQLASGAVTLRGALEETYRGKLGVSIGVLLHLACWIGSALEVWVALHLAGMKLDFGMVLVIESLLYGVRTLAFAIPNAIGVQEVTYVIVGGSFGLTPEVALVLSLLKRARDLLIGVPTLALWQLVEGRRIWRRRRRRLRIRS